MPLQVPTVVAPSLELPIAAPPPQPSVQSSLGVDAVDARSRIPRIIHQSWRDGGFPKGLFNWRWQQGLVDLNPGWELRRWTDESSRALIAKEYPWFLPTYDAYPSYIQRCDASRYFIVHHFGGVYADLDIECSKPFAPVLAGHRAVFSYKQARNMSRGLVNALFATERRHPLWHLVFDLLLNRSAAGATAMTHVDVVRSTGPGLLREAVVALQTRGELVRQGIALLDASVWHPIMPEQKRGRDTSTATAAAIAASHCYHHFVSSWVAHDKQRHQATEERAAAVTATIADAGAQSRAGAVVPTGLRLRASNPWKSYDLPAHGGATGGGAAGIRARRAHGGEDGADADDKVDTSASAEEGDGSSNRKHAAPTARRKPPNRAATSSSSHIEKDDSHGAKGRRRRRGS